MIPTIVTVYEKERGCGFRKPGGLYLRCDGVGWECGALPIPIEVCPCCGRGIKQARGWTWINLSELTGKRQCERDGGCGPCPLADGKIQRAGLLWIGKQFYATPAEWLRESDALGISRRIATVPRDFVIGETWVALAHSRAIVDWEKRTATAGIFHIFRPDRIEYVVRGTETEAELESLAKRGLSLVRVEKGRHVGNLSDQDLIERLPKQK